MLLEITKKWAQLIFITGIVVISILAFLVCIEFFSGGMVSKYINQLNATDYHEPVNIALAQPLNSFSPLDFQFQNRVVLCNVFEGLVRSDAFLKIRPSLAVTYGKIDPLHYEFRIRKGVYFQDGSELSPHDVVKSIKTQMNDSSSQLRSILSNISDVSASDWTVKISLVSPDPVFLQKMSHVYIFKDYDLGEYIGTGPYMISEQTLEFVSLKKNENYWGNSPVVEDVSFEYIDDKEERVAKFLSGDIDIIKDVPLSIFDKLKSSGASFIFQPSLELTFLGYGENVRNNKKLVDLLSTLNLEGLASKLGPSVVPAKQFAPQGVVGYVPDLSKTISNNPEKITAKVSFVYEPELKVVADYILSFLTQNDVVVELKPLSGEELVKQLTDGGVDMYLLGWKSEFGDIGDFYHSVVTKKSDREGLFNAGLYDNEAVNKLIKTSDEMDDDRRIAVLQQIMSIIVNDDPFGLPLLETRSIYAIGKNVDFVPRIDGYMYLSEIRYKNN